jgi:hypothetical protein
MDIYQVSNNEAEFKKFLFAYNSAKMDYIENFGIVDV